MRKRNILYGMVIVLFCFLIVLLVGGRSSEIKIIEQKTERVCNLMGDDECEDKYDKAKENPVQIIDDNTIEIAFEVASGADVRVKSVEEKWGKVVVNLTEGFSGWACGSGFQKIEVKIGRKVSLNKLRVYSTYVGERSDKTSIIYPVMREDMKWYEKIKIIFEECVLYRKVECVL